MKNLIVIEEIDKDKKSFIIGVCDNMEKALELTKEFFGEYEVLNIKDVRDSGIEYIYEILCEGDISKIVYRDFELNKL